MTTSRLLALLCLSVAGSGALSLLNKQGEHFQPVGVSDSSVRRTHRRLGNSGAYNVSDENVDKIPPEVRCGEKMTMQVCEVKTTTECGVCHSMYMKECHIDMEPTHKPVKMRMCKTVRDDSDCKDGYRRECQTKYETECGTKWKYTEIQEDRPVCAVQMVGGKCKDEQESGESCDEVPVMRCKIEKRKVRKRMPSTGCRRIPRQFCRKSKCKPKKTKCFYKIKMVSNMARSSIKFWVYTRMTIATTPSVYKD
jgi:hypothetical protein